MAFAAAVGVLSDAAAAENAAHLAERDGLRVLHGWARATTGDDAMIFADVENRRAGPAVLTGLRTDVAASATLVGTRLSGGGTEALSEIVADPGAELYLDPGAELYLEPGGVGFLLSGLI